MQMMKECRNKLILWIVWFLEGVVVGFGAILPGVSGGTLCVTFGMYRPIIELLNHPKRHIGHYGLMLSLFLIGTAAGFIGLSGLAAWLLEKNTVLVTCAFIGFIAGTFPELWMDAGKEGRNRHAYAAVVLCFAVMLAVLTFFQSSFSVHMTAGITGYALCGLLWGLSFIVPGLSSSSLLLFFGLYQPMLEGIARFDMRVLIPMGFAMAACILFLSKAVGYAYQKHYAVMSHGVMGIVAATVVMIFPSFDGPVWMNLLNIVCIAAGAVVSWLLTGCCRKLRETSGDERVDLPHAES